MPGEKGGPKREGERKRKTRQLRKLKPMKENKHENDTRSRWVNTDVLSCSISHHSPSNTYTQAKTGDRQGENVRRSSRRRSRRKAREDWGKKQQKKLRPGSCPSCALGSQTHQIRHTHRTFVCCTYTVVGRQGAVFVFVLSLVMKRPLQCYCCFG